jgi:hypothetical protein
MNAAGVEKADRELMADVQRMASVVLLGLGTDEPSSVWRERRAQIAALRERIRATRERHLGRTVY